MDEFTLSDHDADVRRALAFSLEEHEIPWPEIVSTDLAARPILLSHFARQQDSMLSEDVLHEPAAIKP